VTIKLLVASKQAGEELFEAAVRAAHTTMACVARLVLWTVLLSLGTASALTSGHVAAGRKGVAATYTTTWMGNTYGGNVTRVQASSACMLPLPVVMRYTGVTDHRHSVPDHCKQAWYALLTQHVLESDGRAFRAKVSLVRNAHEMQASLHITRCIASWTNAMVNIWCLHAQAR
jgi:hypothetical protein